MRSFARPSPSRFLSLRFRPGTAGGFLLLFLLLAGCTVQPARPPVEDPEQVYTQRRVSLEAIDYWTLSGRLSLHTDIETWHVTVSWRQREERYDIRLVAPLGTGSARLTGDAFGAVLYLDDGRERRGFDPEQLLYEELGWWIPVDALRHWILGLPDPRFAARQQLDAFGRLETLVQGPWAVEFRDYQQPVEGLELPTRLFIHSEAAEVRLAIGRWADLSPPPLRTVREGG